MEANGSAQRQHDSAQNRNTFVDRLKVGHLKSGDVPGKHVSVLTINELT